MKGNNAQLVSVIGCKQINRNCEGGCLAAIVINRPFYRIKIHKKCIKNAYKLRIRCIIKTAKRFVEMKKQEPEIRYEPFG